VGKIPKWDGLCKVDRGECLSASTHIANDGITLMDTHRWLGHIAPDTIKALTHQGNTTGLNIDQSSLILSCDSCTYTKMMRAPLPKERTGKCANKFGAGPHRCVGTITGQVARGRSYYISFTNDKTRYTKLALLSQKAVHSVLTRTLKPGSHSTQCQDPQTLVGSRW